MASIIPIKQSQKIIKNSPKVKQYIDDDLRIDFNDTVYGRIYFSHLIVKFIDTPHVQRLRKIRQIRTLQYVFPCASQYTFQHALGTAHLAKTLIQKLIQNNPNHYEGENIHSIIKTITLAGLLYSIGHGPFNHIFDSEVIKHIQYHGRKIKWSHEVATEKLIESMIRQQKIAEFLQQNTSDTIENYKPTKIYRSQIKRIIQLIKGNPNDIRPWQFQVINNKKYGIDVNKIDSLKRDGMSVRADINLNVQELIDSFRIDPKFIDYRQSKKEYRQSLKDKKQPQRQQACLALTMQNFQSIYNIFRFRYMLYKIYHFNVVNQGIQMMIADILKQADKIFKLRQACVDLYSDPKKASAYINLNDDILDLILEQYELRKEEIQNNHNKPSSINIPSQDDESLKKSCELIQRLRNRNLYRFVYQFFYKIEEYQDEEVAQLLQELTQEYLIQGIGKYSNKMKQNICVNIKEIDLGVKKFNPMKKLKFYGHQSIDDKQRHYVKIVSKQEMNKIPLFNDPFYIQKTFKVYLKMDEKKSEYYPQVEQSCQTFHYYFNQKCRRYLQSIGDIYLQQGKGGKIPNKEDKNQITQTLKKQIKNRTPIINNYLGDNYIDVTLGWLALQPAIWNFIDNKYFQRLRKMKQNLALHYVSPCYNNNRFEHSIGVANLARRFIKTIIQNNSDCYVVDGQKQSAIKTVTLAGLLFSLGYTPFNNFLAKKQSIRYIITNSKQFNLEKDQILNDQEYSKYLTILLSLRLFDIMVNEQRIKKLIITQQDHLFKLQSQSLVAKDEKEKQLNINLQNYYLTNYQLQRIRCLIIGKSANKNEPRPWQFQIVNDIYHNIDAVNFDSLLRDSFHLSAFNLHIDYELLMNQCRLIGNKICFPTKYTQHINDIATAKIKLYKEYYKDQQTQKIELILQDLFNTIQQDIQLQKTVTNMLNSTTNSQQNGNFLCLDDDILQVVQNQTGKQILKDLLDKNNYQFVQQIIYTVNPSNGDFSTYKILQAMKYQFCRYSIQQPGFVYVTTSSYGFSGLKTVESVRYFKKEQRQNRQFPQNQKEGLTMLRIEQLALSLNFYIKWNPNYQLNSSPSSKDYKSLEKEKKQFFARIKQKIVNHKFCLNGVAIGKQGTYSSQRKLTE